jgi:hypothetical protein
MSTDTLRANAQTLPEATDRRGFLRSVVAAGAIITASAPLALTSSPAAAAVGNAPVTEENRDLLDVGRRVGELSRKRHQAIADLECARSKFREISPPPPIPRKRADEPFIRIVRNPRPLASNPDLTRRSNVASIELSTTCGKRRWT